LNGSRNSPGHEWQTRIGIYFCAAVSYYVSVSGVSSLDMESMLRYGFCVHALIVLAFLHFCVNFRLPPLPVRALGWPCGLSPAPSV